MKTCQTSIKQSIQQGGEKGTRGEGPKSRGKKESTNKGRLQEEHEQIKYSNP